MLDKKYPIRKYVENLILMNAAMDEMLRQLEDIVLEEDDDPDSSLYKNKNPEF